MSSSRRRMRGARTSVAALRRWRSVKRQVDAVDTAVFAAIADTRSPALDRIMPGLTNVADHSVLWMLISAACAASGNRRARRGALRGLVSLGLTSLLVNQVSKRMHRRPRPPLDVVPLARLSRRVPASTSFPSGHSASAAAFAVGVSAEAPVLGAAVSVLAGLVGVSRVATGAHYPSDVAAGFAIGAGVAGVVSRLVPPVPPPARMRRPDPAALEPPRPTGAGLTLVVNPASHSGTGERFMKRLARALPDVRVRVLRAGDDVDAVMREAAESSEALGVAGGDGTVQAAACAALAADKPLAVFPAGTYNHFAKDARSAPLARAVRAVREGTVGRVDVGYVDDRLFLNTASVGAYPDFVERRERLEKRLGKPLAAVIAGIAALRSARSVRMRVDDVDRDVSLLFIGNGLYQPRGFAPALRQRLDSGVADVRLLEASGFFARIAVIAALVTGQLARSRRYVEISAADLEIALPDGPERIARDGELGERVDAIRVRIDRRALRVFEGRGSD